jgi:long-chain acyl-CoA synthetase
MLAVADSLWQATQPCAIERHLCVLPLATLLENIGGLYAPMRAGAVIDLLPMAEIGFPAPASSTFSAFWLRCSAASRTA